MDPHLTADILAVCDTLGVSDGTTYLKDPQCLSSTKDLVLYLRRDSDQHGVRRLLGEAQILQRDLVPIFKLTDSADDLLQVVLRLMVNLTNPPLLIYEGLPRDKTLQNHFITITRHLQAYKAALVDELFWSVVARKLGTLLESMETLLENEKLTLERILILIRNTLKVPADPSEEMRNDDDASIHDQILWVLQRAGVLDLLLFMAASPSTREFCMHIVESMTLIFREQTGEQLARTALERSAGDVQRDAEALRATLQAESLRRSRRRLSARAFGGTFSISGLQAPSGHDQICHKPIQGVSDLSLDFAKKSRKLPSNRRELVERSTTRRSTLSMRLLLKEFCAEFLNGAYNNLMRSVKDRLTRERGQEHDEVYYLIAMRFFMEFNRHAETELRVGRVSETMSMVGFHYVQGLISNYHELMLTDKESARLWSKRAHTALRAYQELLCTLQAMKRGVETMAAGRVLEASIFYLPEYRELCVGLLASYEPSKLSRDYCVDLMQTNHLFLKMLEAFSRERRVLVRGKGGRRGGKARRRAREGKKKRAVSWNALEEKVEAFLASPFEPQEMIPFDGASEEAVDEQKGRALSRIAAYLSEEEFVKAVCLLRAAKDVWPHDDQLSKDTDISSLKSIFLRPPPLPLGDEGGVGSADDMDMGMDHEDEEQEFEDDDEEVEEEPGPSTEREFDFRGFMEKYTHVKIVANYGNVLRKFEALRGDIIHCVVKMFHRLVFDMGYPALLCQASLFRTFQAILRAAPFRQDLGVAKDFFAHFWPKFRHLAASNPTIFLETLFWKTGREAAEMQEGYTPYGAIQAAASQRKKSTRRTLTAQDEHEVTVLAQEFAALPFEKERNQLDWINEKLLSGHKVKRVLLSFLKEKGLVALPPRKQRGVKPTHLKKAARRRQEGSESAEAGEAEKESDGGWKVLSGSESDLSLSALQSGKKGGAADTAGSDSDHKDNRHGKEGKDSGSASSDSESGGEDKAGEKGKTPPTSAEKTVPAPLLLSDPEDAASKEATSTRMSPSTDSDGESGMQGSGGERGPSHHSHHSHHAEPHLRSHGKAKRVISSSDEDEGANEEQRQKGRKVRRILSDSDSDSN